jgi:hypothetical protein
MLAGVSIWVDKMFNDGYPSKMLYVMARARSRVWNALDLEFGDDY